jgi:hypothetical protein
VLNWARSVVVSVFRSKCGLQYRMKATYASVSVSALTSLGGSERSVGRYTKAGSISMVDLDGNAESRWEVGCDDQAG